jgi:hypothetical protein
MIRPAVKKVAAAFLQSRFPPADKAHMSASKSTAAPERRRSERRPCVCEAFINSPTAVDQSERIEVTAINLSRTGVAFDCAQPLPRKSYYVIEIGMGEQRLVSEVRIVSCRPIEEGIYQVGAEFC